MEKLKRTIITKKSLKDVENDYIEGTPEERIRMVWEITCDTLAFINTTHAERRLQRNVTTIVRGRR